MYLHIYVQHMCNFRLLKPMIICSYCLSTTLFSVVQLPVSLLHGYMSSHLPSLMHGINVLLSLLPVQGCKAVLKACRELI